jgi:hypothetical protein
MAETLNLSKAARLLRLSQKTARKHLSPSYAGSDRIKGAIKSGRDWRIPIQEVNRLVARGKNQIDTAAAAEIAAHAYLSLAGEAGRVLKAAAHKFGLTGWQDESSLAELIAALRDYQELSAMVKLIDAIRKRVLEDDLADIRADARAAARMESAAPRAAKHRRADRQRPR